MTPCSSRLWATASPSVGLPQYRQQKYPGRMEHAMATLRFTTYALRLLVLAALLFAPGVILVQTNGDASTASGTSYHLSWFTVDGGGGLSDNGDYTLHGTAGQPDVSFLVNGEYTLSGGFWDNSTAVSVTMEHNIYLPLLLHN